jgi:hypothetical protein
MKKVKMNLVSYIIVLICTLILTSNLKAATLSVGSTSVSPGDKNISIPIDLTSSSGEKVCGLNFDLNFDTSRLSFKEVTLGSVAVDAGKSLSFNQPSSNTIRVVVVGLNQNVIGYGTVLNFTFDVLDTSSGKAKLIISKPSISDPKGKQLSVNAEGGEVNIFK